MLHNLFPNVSKKKSENNLDNILYLCMVEFGWSYEDFLNTPIPVIRRIIKKHNQINKKHNKKKR